MLHLIRVECAHHASRSQRMESQRPKGTVGYQPLCTVNLGKESQQLLRSLATATERPCQLSDERPLHLRFEGADRSDE